jgi:hypothetical protein
MKRLPPDLQDIVLASRPTWEATLERELAAARATGERYGKDTGVVFLPFAPNEEQRFHAIHNAAARSSAQDLARFGIDGVPILQRAQALVQRSDVEPRRPLPGRGRSVARAIPSAPSSRIFSPLSIALFPRSPRASQGQGSAGALYGTLYVRLHTPAEPPWMVVAGFAALNLIGFLISLERGIPATAQPSLARRSAP